MGPPATLTYSTGSGLPAGCVPELPHRCTARREHSPRPLPSHDHNEHGRLVRNLLHAAREPLHVSCFMLDGEVWILTHFGSHSYPPSPRNRHVGRGTRTSQRAPAEKTECCRLWALCPRHTRAAEDRRQSSPGVSSRYAACARRSWNIQSHGQGILVSPVTYQPKQ